MKKIIKLTCLLLVVICLTSCSTSVARLFLSDYRLYEFFSLTYREGMDKQDVAEKIGYPGSCLMVVDGNVQKQSRYYYGLDDETYYNEFMMNSDCEAWNYSCYHFSGYPYTLWVYFDSDGKCTDVNFYAPKGG